MLSPTRALRRAARESSHEAASEPPSQDYLPKRGSNKRRIDLRSLNGVLRESARIYKDLVDGHISLDTAEVRSRAMARHHDILKAVKDEAHLINLIKKLEEVNSGNAIAWDPDLFKK